MKRMRAALLAISLLASGGMARAQSQLSNDLRNALNVLDPIMQSATTQCTVGNGQIFLFSAVTQPAIPQNPFTPQLVAPNTPAAGTILGYYEFALFLSPQGHYISRMTFPALPVTDADQLNGIDARYQIDFYAKAYRIYDTRTGQWSDWTNEGSFGSDVHYASFVLQRRNGTWQTQGGFLINTNGRLTSVNCATLPPL